MKETRRPTGLLILLLVATTAWIGSPESLQVQADALIAEGEELTADVEQCTDGECAEAQSLIDAVDDLDADRLDLHADRDALGSGCDCPELDDSIAELDGIVDVLRDEIGGWEEQS